MRPRSPIFGTYLTGTKFRVVKAGIFTNTSKMPGPSFAIPAGPPRLGGTCPASALGENKKEALAVLQQRLDEQATERGVRPVQLKRLRVLSDAGPDEEDEESGLVAGVKSSYAGEASFTCRSCLTSDALVMVKGRGLVPIGELVDQGEFEVWSGQAWRMTHAVFQGYRRVVEVRTTWGHRLRMTGDHELLTADGMLQAQELEPGDRLVQELPEETPWPKSAPLPDAALNVQSSDYHSAVTRNFPKTWSRSVGTFLGMILGDGSVSGGRYPTVSILAGIQDRTELDVLQDLVATWCSTKATVVVRDPRTYADGADEENKLVDQSKANKCVRIEWRVQVLANFLVALGLDKAATHASSRRAPSSIWSASEDGVAGFIAGLFGTDGSITLSHSKNKAQPKLEVSLASVSRGLLLDVQQLLYAFGIRSTLCAYETSNEERIAQGYQSLYKLAINAVDHVHRFSVRIGFANERKQKRLVEALSTCTTKGRGDVPFVASVEDMEIEEAVFDLMNVGDEHTFVANGFTVSNCYALGGNYVYPSKQINDMMHLAWCEYELAQGGPQRLGTALAYAIQHINLVRPQGFQPYFRIHDAGDFHRPDYLEAWVVCASMMKHMRFWAPTRQWIFKKWMPILQSAEKRVRDAGGWLVIRPSVLSIGDTIPMQPGLSAGSGVGSEVSDPCTWICPVYNRLIPKTQPDGTVVYEEAVSCLEASCTACWDQPNVPVSYGAH